MLCGLALLAPACSSDGDKLLDLAKAEASITDLTATTFEDEAEIGKVRCPTEVVVKQGAVFFCTVDIDGQPLLIRVTQRDQQGNVRIESAQAVVFTEKVETFVASYAAQNGAPTTSVSCGDKTLATRTPGEYFTCTVEFEDGTSGVARLQVKNTEGQIGMQSLKQT